MLPGGLRTAGVQTHVCAMLCAASASFGLLYVLGEVGRYCGPARVTVAFVGACCAAGIVAGLLGPRLVIQRRIRTERSWVNTQAESGFAATLAGVLLLISAVLWTLLVVFTAHVDEIFALLTERFVHPLWLTLFLLKTPLALGLLLVSAAGATVAVALQGWQRLVQGENARSGDLLPVMLFAALLAGVGTRGGVRPVTLELLCLLAAFAAAFCAVARKPRAAHPAAEPRAVGHTPPPVRPLVMAATAAALAGGALSTALPLSALSSRTAASGWVWLSGAGLLGVIFFRGARWCWPRIDSLGVVLLLLLPAAWGAATVVSHWVGGDPNEWRLAPVTCVAAACVSLVGHHVGDAIGRTPPALAWVGAASAAGYGVGLTAATLLL